MPRYVVIPGQPLTFFIDVYKRQKGIRIPEDISLVGFDHIQSRMALPFDLTTISSYKAKMSITAVECLSCKINRDYGREGHCEEICHHVIATNLVKGETVRDIRG